MTGSIGQPDAGGPMSGGAFSLTGGFFAAPVAVVCPNDGNHDGMVGIDDFLGVLGYWGPCSGAGCAYDGDGDGVVGILDFLAVLAHWGLCP